MLEQRVVSGPRAGSLGPMRRAVDVAVVLLLSPLAILLLLACACAIRLESRGPIFFVHDRVGRGGRPLRLLKLRTMVVNGPQNQEMLHLNVRTLPDFKIQKDPRVTRVGRVLRRSCVDELPQLWNVLVGQMTLVGPRPCSVGLDRYELWQTERLEAFPGLFGTWQAGDRSSADFVARCRLDIGQIRSPSPLGELVLSAKTICAVVLLRGAS